MYIHPVMTHKVFGQIWWFQRWIPSSPSSKTFFMNFIWSLCIQYSPSGNWVHITALVYTYIHPVTTHKLLGQIWWLQGIGWGPGQLLIIWNLEQQFPFTLTVLWRSSGPASALMSSSTRQVKESSPPTARDHLHPAPIWGCTVPLSTKQLTHYNYGVCSERSPGQWSWMP